MILHPILRRAFAAVAAILLLALAWTGILGGVDQWPQSSTVAQRSQTASQIAYGVFALLMLLTAFTWRRWQPIAELGFVACSVVAASLATVVWGGASVGIGAVTALATVAIAGLIVWMLRAGIHASVKRGELR